MAVLKKYLAVFLILLTAWQAGSENARADQGTLPPIRIVTSEFAPFNYIDQGKPAGFCREVVQMLLDKLNINASISTLPWARAYQTALKQKNTLIFTIARTPEREDLFHWVGILVTGNSYLFSLKKRSIYLNSLDDARPYRIGAARNGIRAKFLLDKGFLELDLVVHSRMNAVKLLNQRIDLWAEDELAAIHTIRQLGYDPLDILDRSLALELNPKPSGYLAFSRDTDPSMVEAFKNALSAVIQTDDYQTVMKKYFHLAGGDARKPGIPD